MNKKQANTAKTRECHRCNQLLPLDSDFFVADKSRPHGLAYECRACHSERKKGRDRRKERWSNMTEDQKERRRAAMKRYNSTALGRAVMLRKAYERTDSCDMTTSEVAALVAKPCTYCGTTSLQRGLDRVDNRLPHIRSNVVPACTPCNLARGNRFTMEEMLLIGKVIRSIFKRRAR